VPQLSLVQAPLRPLQVAVSPALFVPRLLAQAAADIHSIAASTRTLTVAIAQLESISDRVDSLDEEVKRMRAAVEAIGGEVETMQGHVAPLGGLASRFNRRGLRRAAPPGAG
jgi:hypothetical protein